MKKHIAKLVTFGKGGDTVYYGAGCTGQGYGSPERPHAAEVRDTKEFPDGTPAIDKRAAVDTDAGLKLALHGPMVNVDLQLGDVDRCPCLEESIVGQAMLAAGNGYTPLVAGQMLARKVNATYGPLDSVDTETYIRLWRGVGARIGQYRNGKIVWE